MPRKPSKKTLENKLDKLVGKWCREVRSKGKCEHCGRTGKNSRDMQWCHIKSRRYLSVRWDVDNCFCLCSTCHRRFTDNPDEFVTWIWDEHPEQYSRLVDKFQPVSKMGVVEMQDLLDKLIKELK